MTTTTFDALIAQFGEVAHDDKRLALTQGAYCSNRPDSATYEALAVDADGNEYRVFWDCVDGWMSMEDESDCCDWTQYTVRAL